MSTDNAASFAAVGFWLPCDQAAFIRHKDDIHHEDDQVLRDLYPLARANEPQNELGNKLDTTVYRRLAIVLARQHYTYAFPVFHATRNHGEDPDAAIFTHPTFNNQSYVPTDPEYALPPNVTLQGLVLLVNSSGYYLWVTQYTSPLLKLEAECDKKEAERKQVEEYLRDYVSDLVGGNFWTHYSGLPEDKNLTDPADPDEQAMNLDIYRQRFLGILTFIQINTILEGLFNSTLDFRVFFYGSASDQGGRVRAAKRYYSLGNFARLVTTRVRELYPNDESRGGDTSEPASDEQMLGQDQDQELKEAVLLLGRLDGIATWFPGGKPPAGVTSLVQRAAQLAQRVFDSFLFPAICEYVLRKFLQATAASVLQEYKRRVERCRRALLTEMIQVTHRQQPLLQVEGPDEREDRIVGVNEAQLRGYIMVFSAKLPLIENVELYLKEIAAEHHAYDVLPPGPDAVTESVSEVPEDDERQMDSALDLWTTLYEALANDLRGLERAIEQARRDRMVQEEEQIRVEQETLAEIERLQERHSKSLSPTTTLTLGLLSNAFALASVVVAIIAIAKHAPLPNPADLTTKQVLQFLAEVLGIGLALSMLYFVAHYSFAFVLQIGVRLLRIHWGERYYYEMDLHMDAPIANEMAPMLLDGKLKPLGWGADFIADAEKTWTKTRTAARITRGIRFWSNLFWPTYRHIERNSYRAERQTPEEAMHKVYLDVTVLLRRQRWYHLFRPAIPLVLVYELLYHRPAQAQRYVLKDLRVVSTTGKVLRSDQLDQIKRIIVVNFINQLIDDRDKVWKIQLRSATDEGAGMHYDALVSLTGDGSDQAESDVGYAQFTWLLRQAGALGLALYVGHVVLNIINAAFSTGLKVINSGSAVAHVLLLDEAWHQFRAMPPAVLLPAAIALLLVLIATGISRVAARLSQRVVEALKLSKDKWEQQYLATPREARPVDPSTPPANDAPGAAGPPATAASPATATTVPAPSEAAGVEQPQQPFAPSRPPWHARAFRWMVRRVWAALGGLGAIAETLGHGAGIVLTVCGWSLAILLGVLVLSDASSWLGLPWHL